MQRDRDFDDYQDDGAFYDRRPSAWVEPVGRLGRRRPCSWSRSRPIARPTTTSSPSGRPAAPVGRRDASGPRYRLSLAGEEPTAAGVAQVVATRVGPRRPPRTAAAAGRRASSSSTSPAAAWRPDPPSGVEAAVTLSRGQPVNLGRLSGRRDRSAGA